MKKDKINYAIRPDAQGFDEIRIRAIPRLKDSELSGSEWRISATTEFYRKGQIIHTSNASDMMTAVGVVFARYIESIDNGKGYFAGDGVHCDQEGCNEKAHYLFRLKKAFCAGPGKCGAEKDNSYADHRCFCNKHKHRGDSGLEDCDANYELVTVL